METSIKSEMSFNLKKTYLALSNIFEVNSFCMLIANETFNNFK